MRLLLVRPAARVAAALVLAAAAGYLAAIRAGRVPSRPGALAALAVCGLVAVAVTLALAVPALARGPARTAAVGEVLCAGGVLLALGAGTYGWARSVSGAFLAIEREPVRLSRAADVVGVQSGPWADPRLLDLTVALARLELKPSGPGAFFPVSHLQVLDAAGDEVSLSVSGETPAPRGELVFHQGAFGFAPRVYVTRGADVLFDATVPLRTSRVGPGGVQFLGEFEVAREALSFRASVDLGPLDADMKGHPLLDLAVERAGAPLGAGALRPGEYVTLDGGYKVLFAGLKRWSEIDFARRRSRAPVAWGLVLAVLGAVTWAAGAWSRR